MTAALLGKALVEAQAAMPGLTKDGKANYGEYVTLDALINAARPVLNEHGLSIQQFPTVTEQGLPALRTRITHTSGEFIEDTMPLLLTKQDSQGLGSAITYARRYALAAILGLATETDDDGNSASAGAAASGGQAQGTGEAGPAPSQFRAPSVKAPTAKQVKDVIDTGSVLVEKHGVDPVALQNFAKSALPWPDFVAGMDPVAFKDFAGKLQRRLANAIAQEQAA